MPCWDRRGGIHMESGAATSKWLLLFGAIVACVIALFVFMFLANPSLETFADLVNNALSISISWLSLGFGVVILLATRFVIRWHLCKSKPKPETELSVPDGVNISGAVSSNRYLKATISPKSAADSRNDTTTGDVHLILIEGGAGEGKTGVAIEMHKKLGEWKNGSNTTEPDSRDGSANADDIKVSALIQLIGERTARRMWFRSWGSACRYVSSTTLAELPWDDSGREVTERLVKSATSRWKRFVVLDGVDDFPDSWTLLEQIISSCHKTSKGDGRAERTVVLLGRTSTIEYIAQQVEVERHASVRSMKVDRYRLDPMNTDERKEYLKKVVDKDRVVCDSDESSKDKDFEKFIDEAVEVINKWQTYACPTPFWCNLIVSLKLEFAAKGDPISGLPPYRLLERFDEDEQKRKQRALKGNRVTERLEKRKEVLMTLARSHFGSDQSASPERGDGDLLSPYAHPRENGYKFEHAIYAAYWFVQSHDDDIWESHQPHASSPCFPDDDGSWVARFGLSRFADLKRGDKSLQDFLDNCPHPYLSQVFAASLSHGAADEANPVAERVCKIIDPSQRYFFEAGLHRFAREYRGDKDQLERLRKLLQLLQGQGKSINLNVLDYTRNTPFNVALRERSELELALVFFNAGATPLFSYSRGTLPPLLYLLLSDEGNRLLDDDGLSESLGEMLESKDPLWGRNALLIVMEAGLKSDANLYYDRFRTRDVKWKDIVPLVKVMDLSKQMVEGDSDGTTPLELAALVSCECSSSDLLRSFMKNLFPDEPPFDSEKSACRAKSVKLVVSRLESAGHDVAAKNLKEELDARCKAVDSGGNGAR